MSNQTDPRAARSREAMLVAARELLIQEGPGAVTHQRVAQQAGIGRATVYRHWPRPEQLLIEVMAGMDLPFFKDVESPVRPWLHQQLRELSDEMVDPAVTAVSLTLMQTALWDSEIAHRRDMSLANIMERIDAAVRSAVADGEVVTDVEPHDLVAMLIGPIVYRTTMQVSPVSDDLIHRLIDSVGTWRPN